MKLPLKMCQLGLLVDARARCDNACVRNKAKSDASARFAFRSTQPRACLRSLRGVMCWILLFFTAGSAVAAQPTFHIPDQPVCARCTLDLKAVATLRAPADSSFYAHFSSTLSRNSKGQYVLAPLDNLGTLAMFDSTGNYIRTLGRKGLGPGEYKIAERAQIGKADSIVVLDAMQHRLSILSPSGVFVSGIDVPAYVRDVLPLGKGHFLINATKSGGLGLSVS